MHFAETIDGRTRPSGEITFTGPLLKPYCENGSWRWPGTRAYLTKPGRAGQHQNPRLAHWSNVATGVGKQCFLDANASAFRAQNVEGDNGNLPHVGHWKKERK